jgi:bis(5'-adenosyl)-triphosphatase
MDQDCPFCNPRVQSKAFMESGNFLALYNIAPILRGHSLVISRNHVRSILDLPDSQSTEFVDFAKKVTEILLSAFKGEGFDWSVQDGSAAGQSIEHLHLHIVIRRKNDLDGNSEWYPKVQANEQELLDTAHRKRISMEEYDFFTDYIKQEIRLIDITDSKKEETNS